MKKKVAFLLADEFEDSEMKNPYDAMTKNGMEAVIISLQKGQTLKGKNGTIEYTSHLSAGDALAQDYEAVVIPGGKSPGHLLQNKRIIEFVTEANQQGKLIAAICHGPQVLAEAGLLRGRTLTGYPGIADEIREAGGHYEDREVIVDGNLITSRTPEDEPAFIKAIIDRLGVEAY
ncbi:type 1 glutamine amidotransferase [Paenibacillus sp. IB182496]|uniref:Type 1 glutamine amidotransferase n=2 Tax=Paenibacillus sabuli TaxID=2772509 RepID=A0A927BU87_9BACL|nr:type 1 glutamine amidotransferase [Paenibacillus sabuli]